MPRQSRGRSSTPPASRPAQTRGAATAAAPAAGYSSTPARAPPAPAAATQTSQAQQPGMLAQMAATAGSVAVGSTIGHGLSSMLFGGRSEAAPAADAAAPAQQARQTPLSCEVQAKDFTLCLEKADLNSCSYYLEQLKACQAAAAPY